MKYTYIISLLISVLLPVTVAAQEVKTVTDESCGCDIVYVDGIETTRSADSLYGFRREDGTVIAPTIYRYVGQFTDGYCKVFLDYGQCGLIDTAGTVVVPCLYDDLEYPSEGRVLVMKGNRMGFTDMRGRVVIPLDYEQAGSFSEGCAPVLVKIDSFFNACTFIDTLGRQLYPPKFQNVQPFECGYALVRQYDRWGIMDHDGNIVLPTVYENLTTLFDTCFFAGDDFGMAFFDRTMQPLTKPVYEWTGGISEGRVLVKRDGKYGFLDRRGREVIPCIYDRIGRFRGNRTMVCRDGKYGIIDTTGRFVLPLEYDNKSTHGEKYRYYDGLALVEKDGKLGYVDTAGQLVIPFYFDAAFQFSEGLASVRFKGMWGYIDTHGDVFMPFVFDLASPYKWGRASVVYMGESRKVDRQGRCVKNCKGIIAWRDWTE